jgi:hypothetical protein
MSTDYIRLTESPSGQPLQPWEETLSPDEAVARQLPDPNSLPLDHIEQQRYRLTVITLGAKARCCLAVVSVASIILGSLTCYVGYSSKSDDDAAQTSLAPAKVVGPVWLVTGVAGTISALFPCCCRCRRWVDTRPELN